MAETRELNASLEQRERLLQREVAVLEGLHDAFELRDRGLEVLDGWVHGNNQKVPPALRGPGFPGFSDSRVFGFSGSQVLGFSGSRTSDLGPRTSDLGPRTSDLGPRASDLGPRASDLGPRASGLGPRASGLDPRSPPSPRPPGTT